MSIDQAAVDEVFPSNPLREVTFEIRFPFNLHVNRAIYDIQSALEKDYPLVSRKRLEADEDDSKNLYVFTNQEESQQVKVSEDALIISFEYYKSFEYFLDEILKCTELVFHSSSIKALTRIGLRYVNLFTLLDEANDAAWLRKFVKPLINPERLQTAQPKRFVAEALFEKPTCFLSSRTVYYQRDETDEDQESFYVLDIDAYKEQYVESEKLEAVLNDLHHEIQLEFLASITDKYKRKMRGNSK
ncbi:MAG: TIGR04255 family protein [Phormidium tanganyikae FI6-MK23]|nr:TIGR04255 family protein [Phormidium tanganyikae FI6-MK23]